MSLRESFWEPRRNPLIYFAVAWAFGMSVNLASGRVADGGKLYWVLVVGVPLAIVIVILSPWFFRLWPRRVLEPVSSLRDPALRYAGLVAFASPGPGIETAEAAVRYHRPRLRWVWLVCSETSRAAADALRGRIVAEGLVEGDTFRLIALRDEAFDDPEAIKAAIEANVYRTLPPDLDEGDVVIDFTGGKKTTTAGAFLAGLPPARHLQLTRAASVDARGRGERAGAPIEFVVSYRLRRVRAR